MLQFVLKIPHILEDMLAVLGGRSQTELLHWLGAFFLNLRLLVLLLVVLRFRWLSNIQQVDVVLLGKLLRCWFILDLIHLLLLRRFSFAAFLSLCLLSFFLDQLFNFLLHLLLLFLDLLCFEIVVFYILIPIGFKAIINCVHHVKVDSDLVHELCHDFNVLGFVATSILLHLSV